ncbi:MAG: S49 family peptidase [Patescibacteria group bacterium]|jgi:protease-4
MAKIKPNKKTNTPPIIVPKPPYGAMADICCVPKQKTNIIRILLIIAIVFVIVNLLVFDVAMIYSQWYTTDDAQITSDVTADANDETCGGNVAGIELHGELVTYLPANNTDEYGSPLADQSASEDIVAAIKSADKDAEVKAIVLEIDSTGGSPVAGEEIASALKNTQKPTIALIRNYGDSAAYWAATGAQTIFASANSDVGAIGVTMSYLDYSKQNQNNGITYQQLSSGKLKDAGDPDKTLTEEERKYFERDVAIMGDNFISDVSRNRHIPIEEVKKLADGSSMLGKMGLDNKLIDRIGGMPEVEAFISDLAGIKPDLCWY